MAGVSAKFLPTSLCAETDVWTMCAWSIVSERAAANSISRSKSHPVFLVLSPLHPSERARVLFCDESLQNRGHTVTLGWKTKLNDSISTLCDVCKSCEILQNPASRRAGVRPLTLLAEMDNFP